jgi:N-acetyl-anhydromuramyl-L-alanine amidase AmpD
MSTGAPVAGLSPSGRDLEICRRFRPRHLTWQPSVSFSARPTATPIDSIIIHYTDLNLEWSLKYFLDPVREVSTHYLIDRNGSTQQLVSVDRKAWHAGKSSLDGTPDVNGRSIGIDLVFSPKTHRDGYTDPQYEALAGLANAIRQVLPIQDHLIVGHEHVAEPPGRKADPGPLFQWERFFRDIGITDLTVLPRRPQGHQ